MVCWVEGCLTSLESRSEKNLSRERPKSRRLEKGHMESVKSRDTGKKKEESSSLLRVVEKKHSSRSSTRIEKTPTKISPQVSASLLDVCLHWNPLTLSETLF
jgi:hypothetical protein